VSGWNPPLSSGGGCQEAEVVMRAVPGVYGGDPDTGED
jgi:hypothetical protein